MTTDNEKSDPPRTSEYRVAEISKNWPSVDGVLISQIFEQVLNVNFQLGYELLSYQLHRCQAGECLNETIIAVFKRKD